MYTKNEYKHGQVTIKIASLQPRCFAGKRKRRRLPIKKLKWYEFAIMPCLVPNVVGFIVGFVILCSGALLCYVGYNPEMFRNNPSYNLVNTTISNDDILETVTPILTKYKPLMTFIGSILMGTGLVVAIVAVVLYCEIREKHLQSIMLNQCIHSKKCDLYDNMIEVFKKKQSRCNELKRKLSEMPMLYETLDVRRLSFLFTPEVLRRHQRRRRTNSDETWLKTTSMPNINTPLPEHSHFHGDRNIDKEKIMHKDNSRPKCRESAQEAIELDDISPDFKQGKKGKSRKTDMTQCVVHIDTEEDGDLTGCLEITRIMSTKYRTSCMLS
jgi:hypothetical protein